MIQLPQRDLPPAIAAELRALQGKVDEAPTYAARVELAAKKFKDQNKVGRSTFDGVKVVLREMCSGARRCAYCEDSAADEVEHIWPKNLYPELVFAWANYLYSCGPCNSPKGNQFAVFTSGGEVLEVGRKRGAPVEPPPAGDPVPINPRTEDATAFLDLDLGGTFLFKPIAAKGTREHARAAYTIKMLKLNGRDDLPPARREAYHAYLGHVTRYQVARAAGADAARLDELAARVRRCQHPTVWREMQRQHDKYGELRALFAAVPEALGW